MDTATIQTGMIRQPHPVPPDASVESAATEERPGAPPTVACRVVVNTAGTARNVGIGVPPLLPQGHHHKMYAIIVSPIDRIQGGGKYNARR